MHVRSHTLAYACQNYMHLCLLPSQVYDLKSRGHCSRSARVWQAVLKKRGIRN